MFNKEAITVAAIARAQTICVTPFLVKLEYGDNYPPSFYYIEKDRIEPMSREAFVSRYDRLPTFVSTPHGEHWAWR